jgi:hypothetical protein
MYVYVCMYVCICMYVYVYVCMCIYMYVCVCICMYMYIYVCMGATNLANQCRPNNCIDIPNSLRNQKDRKTNKTRSGIRERNMVKHN